MKKNKVLKVMALLVCAILLVVGSVAGTFAYLTFKTATVTNTFTAGNVKITLDEAKVDVYGIPANPEVRQEKGTDAYKLIPGHTYTKDPTISVVAGSEECYIFFKLENGLGDKATFNIDADKWALLSGSSNVYYYKTTAKEGDKCIAFTTFTLATNADVDIDTLVTKDIKITAYAVQADGVTGVDFAAKAAQAWTNGAFG